MLPCIRFSLNTFQHLYRQNTHYLSPLSRNCSFVLFVEYIFVEQPIWQSVLHYLWNSDMGNFPSRQVHFSIFYNDYLTYYCNCGVESNSFQIPIKSFKNFINTFYAVRTQLDNIVIFSNGADFVLNANHYSKS